MIEATASGVGFSVGWSIAVLLSVAILWTSVGIVLAPIAFVWRTVIRPRQPGAPDTRTRQPAASVPTFEDTASKLRDLAGLHNEQILSDEEYESRRQKLVERL